MSIPEEAYAMHKIYSKTKLMTKTDVKNKFTSAKYLCFMQKSIGIKEMTDCLARAGTDQGIVKQTIRRLR